MACFDDDLLGRIALRRLRPTENESIEIKISIGQNMV